MMICKCHSRLTPTDLRCDYNDPYCLKSMNSITDFHVNMGNYFHLCPSNLFPGLIDLDRKKEYSSLKAKTVTKDAENF